ncbi:tetratricopeptide repeat-containing diguanylate cyclase [Shewanella algae]|uniref:diguanylate cyclase n=1 Tax=Shewanella algae TaxID=38313 RepID=A0A380BEG0_9GAMM|nr:tetratricopeptide repeat-containing diguanylate cyclase [Shewanella algae]MBO2608519.1 GGDEF domain-containing protein [Shewanella algae]SUJ00158.1 Stalked cell differentiation-controlling protein [Shewanella algae]
MYFFRVMFIASMLLVGLAQADELDDIEISFREQPRQLHSTVVSSLPESLQYPSLEQFQSSALEVGFAPDQLMDKLILLARLDLDAQVLVPGRLEQAQDIIEQLKIIARSDYEKAALYNLEGRYLGRVDQQYEQTVALNQQALEQLGDAQDKRSQLLRYVIYEDLGTVNLIAKQAIPSLNAYNLLRDTAYRLRNDYLIANAEAALGKYYNINGQRTKSLQHYTEAFRLASRYNHPNQKALLQLNLAKLYRDMEQWDEALEYAHGAADAYKAMGSGSFLSHTMTVIAMVYGNTGEWNKAIDYYLNAQQIDAELKNFIAQGLNFHNLGEAYFHLNDYQVALDYLFQANEIFKDRKSNHYLVYNEMLIAEVGQAMEDWPLTMQHAIEALRLAKLLELPDEQIEALGYQTAAYKAQGKFQQALASQEESIQLQQAMLEKEQQTTSDVNSSAVTEQKLKLEVGQLRQDQLQRQEALHTRNILLAISLGLCLLLLALAMQQYRLRKQMAKKNQAQKAKMQLEPMSGLPGYRALLGSISSKTKGLALLSLEQEYRHFQRNKQPLWLAVADIDHFKSINDSFGHTTGDKTLQVIAMALKNSLRDTEFVARYGGEEFVLIIPDVSPKDIEQLLNRVREKIKNIPFKFKNQRITVTVSIGAAQILDGEHIQETFERADAALYKAKHESRDRVIID